MKATAMNRLTALAVTLAMLVPLSPPADARPQRETDLARMAAELRAILGDRAVEMERAGSPQQRSGRTAPSLPIPRAETPAGQQAILQAMNRQRAAYGLAPLRSDERLARAAGDRISDMFHKSYFDHVSPDGIQPFSWIRQRGYGFATAGENLAAGYPSAEAVVNGWMNSPGHRANILSREFADVGIAVAPGSPTNRMRGPTYVALYAREAGARLR
jgi:uncharacterized protein YkwD